MIEGQDAKLVYMLINFFLCKGRTSSDQILLGRRR